MDHGWLFFARWKFRGFTFEVMLISVYFFCLKFERRKSFSYIVGCLSVISYKYV